MDHNNPAEVLSYWLTMAENYGADETVPASKVWMGVWGLTDDLPGNCELLARAASLTATTKDVRERASSLPVGAILLSAFDEVEAAIANFRNVKGLRKHAFFMPINDTGRLCLRQLTEFLASDGHPRLEVDGSDVHDLVGQTRALIDAFRADDELPVDLRIDAIERLQEVVTDLLRFDVGGPREAKRAADAATGLLVRIGLRSQEFLDHPLVRTLGRICGGIAVLVGLGADYQQLTAAGGVALFALPPGGSVAGGAGGGGST